MSSNLVLFVGPVFGLLVARLFGRWRPLTALAAAVVGEFVVLGAWTLWQRHRMMRLLAAPRSHRDMFLIAHGHPTLGERLLGFSVFLLIAGVFTMFALGVQFFVTRQLSGPPTVD